MSSFLQKAAFALIALSLALPALVAADVPERRERGAWAHSSSSGVSGAPARAERLGGERGHPVPVLSAATEGRPGPARSAEGWLPLGPALDGEHDDLESVDEAALIGRSPLPRPGRLHAAAPGPVQHGFSEGLFAARVSRGPPLD
jgi:hypothetical protein